MGNLRGFVPQRKFWRQHERFQISLYSSNMLVITAGPVFTDCLIRKWSNYSRSTQGFALNGGRTYGTRLCRSGGRKLILYHYCTYNLVVSQSLQWLRYGLDDRVSILRQRVHTGFGDHPASYTVWVCDFIPRAKVAEREADHSPAFNFEVKNA
jgi:hypothetical protein